MIRVLAEYNPEDFPRVLRWHLRDALLAYEHRLRDLVRQDYYVSLLIYAATAPHMKKNSQVKPPKPPKLLDTE